MTSKKQVYSLTVDKIVYRAGAKVTGAVPNTTVLPALNSVAAVAVTPTDATGVTNAFNALVADLRAKGYMA